MQPGSATARLRLLSGLDHTVEQGSGRWRHRPAMALRVPRPQTLTAALLGLFFMGAGAMHFIKSSSYEAIVPPSVPYPAEVVAVSGVAEIVGGAAVLVPRLRRWARWWLIALLIAVFPANVHMAINPEQIRGLSVPQWLLWARLPLQGLLIVWVLAATRRSAPPSRLGGLGARAVGALRGR